MKYKFKTTPWPHQYRALRKMVRNGGGALWMPMRSGKSKVAIDWVGALHLKYGVTRVLVVCPKSVKGTWRVQIKRHLPDELRGKIKWHITNYEQLYSRITVDEWRQNVPNSTLLKFSPQVIILDEGHKIGDPGTVQSKHAYRLQRDLGVPYKMVMTGTPFHRKPLLVFGMWKFLDESIFGSAVTPFRKHYAIFGGYGNFQILKYINQKEMLRKMRPQTYMLRKVPIIPEQHVEITYKLEESLEPYVAMEKESYALGIEATNPLSRATRLSQIASGRIRREGKKSVARTGREKQRAYDGLLEQFVENDVKKIVVFTRWLPTFRDIVEVNGKHDYASLLFHGGTTDAEREQRIAEFEETDQPTVFLAQSQTGSMGIDLSSASVAVYYTLPSGLVDWDQTHARIRKWHEKRTLAYYYLLASGTVELGQYLAFKHGLELVEALEKHPELFAEQIRG